MFKPAARPISAEGVGKYAIKFHWNDGHETGDLFLAVSSRPGSLPVCRRTGSQELFRFADDTLGIVGPAAT
jgi:hypothetical protein